MAIDFRVVNAALLPIADSVVPGWLPGGTKRGAEWVTTNPTRGDKNPGSFSVNLVTGQWCDFAGSAKDRGGDLVWLYAYLFHNGNQVEAARELMRQHSIIDNAETRQAAAQSTGKVLPIDENKPKAIWPCPPDVPQKPATFKHFQHGEASRVWEYRDREGRLLCYIARYDVQPRKQIVPWSWAHDPKMNGGKGGHRWAMVGISGDKPRPLYGLQKLAQFPGHDVLLVEGEKAADAAQELFGDACVVLSWMGGTAAANKARLDALEGRRVFLWPDFDAQREKGTETLMPVDRQPGMAAMQTIAQRLRGIVADANILVVPYRPLEKPDGWDLADGVAEGMTLEQAMEIMGRARDPRSASVAYDPAPVAKPAQVDGSQADDQAEIERQKLPVNRWNWPDTGDKGAPLDTIENLEYLLRELDITVRYNVIAKDIQIHIPGRRFSQDNHMEGCLATIGSLCARNAMPRANVQSYITTLADANPYNPAAEWIDAKPWDGQDRITALAATLDARNPELAHALLRKWMIGAVACVYEREGFAMQGAIVLQGAQNLGKTTWIMNLANNNRGLIKEAAVINTDKLDTIKQAISHWLVELGELEATFSKSDITALRGFITLKMDEMRLPYAKASSKFPRRTAFIASVNDRAYLRDETGNRRYWTVECGPGFNAMHGIDMQQAWAQAKAAYQAGEQHHLSREENAELAEHNEAFTEQNPISELIGSHFDWAEPATYRMTATEVVKAIGYKTPTPKDTKAAAAALRKFTGKDPYKYGGRLVFEVPPTKHNSQQIYNDDATRPF